MILAVTSVIAKILMEVKCMTKEQYARAWDRACKRVKKGAQKRGIDLSKILIVPEREPSDTLSYIAPWETVRKHKKLKEGLI